MFALNMVCLSQTEQFIIQREKCMNDSHEHGEEIKVNQCEDSSKSIQMQIVLRRESEHFNNDKYTAHGELGTIKEFVGKI